MKYKKSVFIFRRDLRLFDNTALIEALENSEKVIPVFILDRKLLDKNRETFNSNVVQFMVQGLKELNEELKSKGSKLYLFDSDDVEIIKKLGVDCLFENYDYTPFAKERSQRISQFCDSKNIGYNQFHDYLLNEPNSVLKDNGTPYGVFTPFWKRSILTEVSKPRDNNHTNYYTESFDFEIDISELDSLFEINDNILLQGGRKESISMLENIKSLSNYSDVRDKPSLNTSHLSAHLRFGTVSIRETYSMMSEALGENHSLIRQLYWRDFWIYIAYHFPKVFTENYIEKTNSVEWSKDDEKLNAWKEGRTGFPIVDAGMRELKETGYMHNRVRMVVASFLTKDLHIHWRKGEKHFAKYLVDFDPSVNNGNWQWGASTGCDGQPYFRVFNPWLQQLKFDEECVYIKKWIPELKDVSPKAIHHLDKDRPLTIGDYPRPIVDHKVESKIAIERFKSIQ